MSLKYPEIYESYYYWPQINVKSGIKPVYGATGLGKTHGIKESIKRILPKKPTQKFIYITNRHALIRELYEALNEIGEEIGFKVCYLKSDIETLRDLLQQNELLDILKSLIRKGFFGFDFFKDKNEEGIEQHFATKITRIKRYQADLKDTENYTNKHLIEAEIQNILVQILQDVKRQFFAFKHWSRSKYDQLIQNQDIWELFPYIRFEQDQEAKVLLGTVQKFCRGFFNGKRSLKLHDLKDSREGQTFTIFLDEFDFLENEILDILCEEPHLRNPIEFIRFFMEDFKDWRESEFWDQDQDLRFVKSQMQRTLDFLEKEIKANGFKFPQIRKFTFDNQTFEEGNKKRFVLFQNNHTILSEKFYLEQKTEGRRAYNLVKQSSEHTVNTYAFFKMIKSATEQLLRTFDSVRDRGNILESLIREIWDTKNDNTKGKYNRYISENYTYRGLRENHGGDADFSYFSGFSLITIKKENHLDPNLADLEQLEVITSPESMIAQLAQNNLVFALSATADIPRMVNAFNLDWLRENTSLFISPTHDDIERIKQGKSDKAQKRNSQVKFFSNQLLSPEHSLYEVIKTLSKTGFYQDKSSQKEQKAPTYRKERSLRFFGCLDWILKESQNRTHLVFCNTFKREILFFDEQILEEANFNDLCRRKLAEIGFRIDKKEPGYQLSFQGKVAHLIFLDARKNKDLGEHLIKQGKFDPRYDQLFTDPHVQKVILITQYATASNGLNLRCLNLAGSETDFGGIHLLEPKHFWFDTDQTSSEKDLHNRKKAFWYLWKLYKNQELGEQRFKSFLRKKDLKGLNNFYKNTDEYVLNQIALFHQALGRVDRKWEEMSLIEVTLASEVQAIFARALTEPQYKEVLEPREIYTSAFILKLNKQILKSTQQEEQSAQFSAYEDITKENHISQEKIKGLVDAIHRINQEKCTDQEAKDIIFAWQELRECVLKQDTHAEISWGEQEISFEQLIFKTSHLQEENKLFVAGGSIFPHENQSTGTWNLDHPFFYIQKNDFLKIAFRERNYAISYIKRPSPIQRIFTPYIQQAILKGAIGEKCIKMLLEREGIFLEEGNEELPALYELYDAKLRDKPIYIDFKNFGHRTQDQFSFPQDEGDPLYEEDFDSQKFLQKVKRKLEKIRNKTNTPEAKYIVINFISKPEKRNQFFDMNLETQAYSDHWHMAVIPSSITPDNPQQVSTEFQQIVRLLTNL